MQISEVMTSYTQPNFDQIWWKRTSQPICIRNVWFFAVRFYYMCSTIWAEQFRYHGKYWVPDLPNIKGISGRLWRSIFLFANGASNTWSNRHINMFVALFNKWVGTGKDWVAMETKFSIAVQVFSVELLAYQVSMVCDANWRR